MPCQGQPEASAGPGRPRPALVPIADGSVPARGTVSCPPTVRVRPWRTVVREGPHEHRPHACADRFRAGRPCVRLLLRRGGARRAAAALPPCRAARRRQVRGRGRLDLAARRRDADRRDRRRRRLRPAGVLRLRRDLPADGHVRPRPDDRLLGGPGPGDQRRGKLLVRAAARRDVVAGAGAARARLGRALRDLGRRVRDALPADGAVPVRPAEAGQWRPHGPAAHPPEAVARWTSSPPREADR